MKPVHILSILFYCCFLLPQQFVSGQIPGMKVYTQLDGYPGTVGYVINQDNRGFLWIGTDKGAVCFDGKSFRVYDDRHGLADKEIIAAVPTGNDNVMLMPILNNFSYYKNGRIITKSSELRKIKHRDINRLFFDKHTNKLWLSDGIRVNDSLNYFYNDSVKTIKLPFKSFFTISTIINDKAYISVQDDQSKTVVFMRYHIYREVYDTLHVGPVNLKSTLYTISENEKYFVIHDYDEIDVFELSSDGKLKKIAGLKSKQPVSNTYIDKNNHLYSTCQNGGLEYWGAINKIHENKKPYYFFDGIIINHVWIDHHNNKWFTAKHNGLLFVSEKHWENALFIQQKVLPSYTPAAISGDSTG
ncbi:MAG TPA: hypothetical protein VEC12_15585, partial [Bacteroidia bacterium]|nr:hypothetical protein [Bacteroidia bacterium]